MQTIAGTDWLFRADGQRAADAPLGSLDGPAVDSRGNVYFSDIDNNLVLRLNANGTVTVVPGNGLSGFSGDGGAAISAPLNAPRGIEFDAAGNLYVAEQGLAPNLTGLYQVNARVGAGTAAGDDVVVVLTVAGQESSTVTVAVR
ncbi:MAG: hypothetical protein ACRD44_17115 [Bryobacteraceae bacterium]